MFKSLMQTAVAIIVLMRFLEAKRKKKTEGEEKERKIDCRR